MINMYDRPKGVPLEAKTVLVVDMCGFSQSVCKRGIFAALDDVFAFREKVIERNSPFGGEIVAFFADNAYMTFNDEASAVGFFETLREEMGPKNVSGGIASGEILVVRQEDKTPIDFWGPAVNTASKLGEDTAGPGELLIDGKALA